MGMETPSETGDAGPPAESGPIGSGPRSAQTVVALKYRLLYGAGYLAVALTTNMTLVWLLKRYLNVYTTEGALAVAVILGRLVDAVADPLVGFWRDRVNSRWGRPKPFILVGGPIPTLTFVLIWQPPYSETGQGIVMAVGLLVAAMLLPFMPPAAARLGRKRLLGGAMVADIVDRDAHQIGQRREAMYFGAQGLIVKTGLGVGVGMAALLPGRFGETAARQGGFTACASTAMLLSWTAASVPLARYDGN